MMKQFVPTHPCTCEKPEDTFSERTQHYGEHFVPTGWELEYGTLQDAETEPRFLYLTGYCDHCFGSAKSGSSICGTLVGEVFLDEAYRLMRTYRPHTGHDEKTGWYSHRVSNRSRWYQQQDDLSPAQRNAQFTALFHEGDRPAVQAWLDAHHSEEPYTRPRRDRKSTLFYAILERMGADGSLAAVEPILDYILPSKHEPNWPDEDTYLTDYRFDLVPRIDFGGSEGIYVCLYLEGSFDATEQKLVRVATFKTLRTDLEACLLMGELCGALLYHGTAYVNENIHRYTPQAELEAEYQRMLERRAT